MATSCRLLQSCTIFESWIPGHKGSILSAKASQRKLGNVTYCAGVQLNTSQLAFHTCLLIWLYCICSWKLCISIAHSRNADSLSKVLDSVIHEKTTTTNTAFPIFPESSQSICAWTCQSHFWTHCACAKDRNNADLPLELLHCWRERWHLRELWSSQ